MGDKKKVKKGADKKAAKKSAGRESKYSYPATCKTDADKKKYRAEQRNAANGGTKKKSAKKADTKKGNPGVNVADMPKKKKKKAVMAGTED